MQHAERTTMRKRLITIAFMTWIILLKAGGVCFANPITPRAPYVGTVRQYVVYATLCLVVVIITTGVYLLLWRVVTFPKKRKNSIKNHGLVFSYVVLGLFLGQYYIGFVFLAFGLVKGTRVFFEDVRPEEGKFTGIRTAVCVWVYNAVLILLWQPIADIYEGFYYFLAYNSGYYSTASAAMLQLFDFVHWYSSRDLIIFFVACGIWIITLLVYLGRKGIKEFLKHIPDIITVFGMLFTGYWFWYYGGFIFYFLALGFAMCFLSGFPAYYRDLFLPGSTKDIQAVKQEVENMDAAEIIKELEESGKSVDRTTPLRKLRKQLIQKRLKDIQEKQEEQK